MKLFILAIFFLSTFAGVGQSQPEKSFKTLQKFAQENNTQLLRSFDLQRADEGEEFDEEMVVFFLKLGSMSYADYLKEIDIPASENETITTMIDLTSTMIEYFLVYPMLHEDPDGALTKLIPLLQKIEELTMKLEQQEVE
jgi:hypothetical protein